MIIARDVEAFAVAVPAIPAAGRAVVIAAVAILEGVIEFVIVHHESPS